MENKEHIINELNKHHMKLGCYSEILDQASKRTITRALDFIGDYHDLKCTIKGKPFIIELATVNNEFDMIALTPTEYRRYL